jgi:hypothetical protein
MMVGYCSWAKLCRAVWGRGERRRGNGGEALIAKWVSTALRMEELIAVLFAIPIPGRDRLSESR